MAEEENRESLLKEYYYPDCPGCKVEQRKASQQGFPFRDVLNIWFIVVASCETFFPSLFA